MSRFLSWTKKLPRCVTMLFTHVGHTTSIENRSHPKLKMADGIIWIYGMLSQLDFLWMVVSIFPSMASACWYNKLILLCSQLHAVQNHKMLEGISCDRYNHFQY